MVDVKQLYPLELAEYMIAQGIDNTPAFAWWILYVLRKWKYILAAVNSCYHKQMHKYGFEIPKMVKRAHEIDKENGNTMWQDTIAKEMSNVQVTFKILPDGSEEPVGHQ